MGNLYEGMMMDENTIEMMGKPIVIEISAAARRQLDKRLSPLLIEMELYFSCLLRKQLRVYEDAEDRSVANVREKFSAKLSDDLLVSFRPVMTKSCSVSSCNGEEPPLSDFPIEKPRSYIPKWVTLDYRKGEWCGDFGY